MKIDEFLESKGYEKGFPFIYADVVRLCEEYHQSEMKRLPEVGKTMTAEEIVMRILFMPVNDNSVNKSLRKGIELLNQFISQFRQDVTDEEIDSEVRKLPYTKHLDDGQFNDGQMSGFEQGAKWMRNRMKGGEK